MLGIRWIFPKINYCVNTHVRELKKTYKCTKLKSKEEHKMVLIADLIEEASVLYVNELANELNKGHYIGTGRPLCGCDKVSSHGITYTCILNKMLNNVTFIPLRDVHRF